MAQKKTTPTTESTPSAKAPAALIAKVGVVLNPEFAGQAVRTLAKTSAK
ncbi:MAG: hypothetical protein ACKO36_09885 [Actinomycetota bacterium]